MGKQSRSKRKSKFSLEIEAGAEYQIRPVKVIADGAIAHVNAALGRLVPVLIVDSANRPDIIDIVEAHTTQNSGDVTARWANPDGYEKSDPDCLVHLILHFIRPIDSYVIMKFQKKHAGLVDHILRGKLVYLQPGSSGDRLATTMEAGRVLIEIRNTDFDGTWEKMLHKTVYDEFRMRGLNQKQSVAAAREAISKWRTLDGVRVNKKSKTQGGPS